MNIETKYIGGNIVEVKQVERNGIKVGVIKGHIATWDLDRGAWGVRDRFVKGAFIESLDRHRRDNRPIRLKDHHGRTIGGFPIETALEDEVGLFVIGEINLEVQQGREAFALAKQGILSDFSIGFSSLEDTVTEDIRVIHKAEVWEGSIVDEPMNPKAKITEVKIAVPFQDLPLASQDRPWDSDAAISRVREFTDSTEEPSSTYRRAFLWYDRTDAENFGAYKLPIADVINGRLTAVPRGIFAAAAALQGARGGVDIPDADRPAVIRHVERYYAKMGLDSPFEDDEKQYFVADDVKAWTERDIERFLKETGKMSKSAAKTLADRLDKRQKEPDNEDDNDIVKLLGELKSFKNQLAN
ncbi:MAG: HK97 family phage prohead protease [Phycisphaeraceae bacterium]|nr:HK97 family phage prohead protease [Phycisphaeraceae bacterium]